MEHVHDTMVQRILCKLGESIRSGPIKLVLLYLCAIVGANLLVAHFGPLSSKYTAFAFIGLDLTVLDHLHDAWHRRGLWWKMGILIAVGSGLSWLLNRNAGRIGVASFVAFAISGIIDRLIYAAMHKGDQWQRVTVSNLGSGLADSVLFPALAFGWPLDPDIVFGQFTAKMAGGAFWQVVLSLFQRKPATPLTV